METSWPTLLRQIGDCRACGLCQGILNKVPGHGDPHARLMLIGEGPGAEEDRQGLPFVGAAGFLLTKMLASIGLSREEVYIANIVKCRPPDNRVPTWEEGEACLPFLRAQVALVRPQVIALMGATAFRHTVSDKARISQSRGKWIERKGTWLMPTYHPAALLRDESKKADSWQDLRLIRDKLSELESRP